MTNLIPWRRGRDESAPSTSFRSELDRLFDRFLDLPLGLMGPAGGARGMWSPLMEVRETDNEFVVCAEVPGMEPDDIDITVTGNMLQISGEKRQKSEDQGEGFHRSERQYGFFRRGIELPTEVDADNIRAEYHNGELTVHVPKSPAQQPRRVKVTAKESAQRSGQQGGQRPAAQGQTFGQQGSGATRAPAAETEQRPGSAGKGR